MFAMKRSPYSIGPSLPMYPRPGTDLRAAHEDRAARKRLAGDARRQGFENHFSLGCDAGRNDLLTDDSDRVGHKSDALFVLAASENRLERQRRWREPSG